MNPNATEILGIKAYPSLKDIEDKIDLVVSSIPASMTLGVIEECVEKKVNGVVLVSGGFSEAGEQGVKIQDKIAHILKQHGIRALGPNALSPINTSNNFIVSFHPLEKLTQGSLSFIFQSGFYELRLNWLLLDFHLGISKIIDLGNKSDINEVDALEYLAEDPDTKAIAIHLETVKGDAKKFAQLLKNTSKSKPIVVLKSGRTPAGAKAAASHTGSIARESDVVFDALLKQAGVVRAQSIEDFFDFAKAFSFLNPPSGNRIALATLPGGEAVIATDICQQYGLSMAKPSRRTLDKVKAIFPPWEIPLNPFDMGISWQFHPLTEVYDVYLSAMLDDDNVDCVAVQLPPLDSLSDSKELYKPFLQAKERRKPVVIWRTALSRHGDVLVENLESNSIPVYPSAEGVIKALSALYKYKTMHQEVV